MKKKKKKKNHSCAYKFWKTLLAIANPNISVLLKENTRQNNAKQNNKNQTNKATFEGWSFEGSRGFSRG